MTFRHWPSAVSTLTIALALATPGAASAAELGRLDIAAPGAMISTCGGANFGGAIGDRVTSPTRFSCDAAQTASPSVTVSAAATYLESPVLVSGEASGQTVMGQTRLFAHFKGSHEATGFAAAAATGGWVDVMTLNPLNAALIGQTASFSFQLDLSGTLAGQGVADSWNSAAQFGVRPYLNDAMFVAGPGDSFIVGGQGQFGFRYNQTVNQIVTFTTNITLGTAFELGVFARAFAGIASLGSVAILSEATVDFSNTITWAGISALTVAGNPVPYTLNSVSGIDWTQPYTPAVPEPISAWLWAAGLVCIGGRRLVAVRRLRGQI